MFEQGLSFVLKRILRDFVEDGDFLHEKVQVGVWSGLIVLENLVLKPSILSLANAPVSLGYGHIGRLEITIPWSKLGSEPITIVVNNVNILLEPKYEWHPGSVEAREQAVKQAKLAAAELFASQRLEQSFSQNQNKGIAGNWLINAFLGKLINNTQVTLREVHIRYEDKQSCPSHFCAGISFESLHFQSREPNGKYEGNFSPMKSSVVPESNRNYEKEMNISGQGSFYKLIELNHLAVYWNPLVSKGLDMSCCAFSGRTPKDIQNFMSKCIITRICKPHERPRHHYILHPVDINAFLDISAENGKAHVRFFIAELNISLEDRQLREIISIAINLLNFMKLEKYSSLRPTVPVMESPIEWFRYAAKAVLSDIKSNSRKRFGTTQFNRRIEDKLVYIELWKCKLVTSTGTLQQLGVKSNGIANFNREDSQLYIDILEYARVVRKIDSSTDVAESLSTDTIATNYKGQETLSPMMMDLLQSLEKELSFEDLLYFRSLAEKSVSFEARKASWVGSLLGWATGGKVSPDEERRKLFEALKYDADSLFRAGVKEGDINEINLVINLYIKESTLTLGLTVATNPSVFQAPIPFMKLRMSELRVRNILMGDGTHKRIHMSLQDIECFEVLPSVAKSKKLQPDMSSHKFLQRRQLHQADTKQSETESNLSFSDDKSNYSSTKLKMAGTGLPHIFVSTVEIYPVGSEVEISVEIELEELEIWFAPQARCINSLVAFMTWPDDIRYWSELEMKVMNQLADFKSQVNAKLEYMMNNHTSVLIEGRINAPVFILHDNRLGTASGKVDVLVIELGLIVLHTEKLAKAERQRDLSQYASSMNASNAFMVNSLNMQTSGMDSMSYRTHSNYGRDWEMIHADDKKSEINDLDLLIPTLTMDDASSITADNRTRQSSVFKRFRASIEMNDPEVQDTHAHELFDIFQCKIMKTEVYMQEVYLADSQDQDAWKIVCDREKVTIIPTFEISVEIQVSVLPWDATIPPMKLYVEIMELNLQLSRYKISRLAAFGVELAKGSSALLKSSSKTKEAGPPRAKSRSTVSERSSKSTTTKASSDNNTSIQEKLQQLDKLGNVMARKKRRSQSIGGSVTSNFKESDFFDPKTSESRSDNHLSPSANNGDGAPTELKRLEDQASQVSSQYEDDSDDDSFFSLDNEIDPEAKAKAVDEIKYLISQRESMKTKLLTDIRLAESDPSKQASLEGLKKELTICEMHLHQIKVSYVEMLMKDDDFVNSFEGGALEDHSDLFKDQVEAFMDPPFMEIPSTPTQVKTQANMNFTNATGFKLPPQHAFSDNGNKELAYVRISFNTINIDLDIGDQGKSTGLETNEPVRSRDRGDSTLMNNSIFRLVFMNMGLKLKHRVQDTRIYFHLRDLLMIETQSSPRISTSPLGRSSDIPFITTDQTFALPFSVRPYSSSGNSDFLRLRYCVSYAGTGQFQDLTKDAHDVQLSIGFIALNFDGIRLLPFFSEVTKLSSSLQQQLYTASPIADTSKEQIDKSIVVTNESPVQSLIESVLLKFTSKVECISVSLINGYTSILTTSLSALSAKVSIENGIAASLKVVDLAVYDLQQDKAKPIGNSYMGRRSYSMGSSNMIFGRNTTETSPFLSINAKLQSSRIVSAHVSAKLSKLSLIIEPEVILSLCTSLNLLNAEYQRVLKETTLSTLSETNPIVTSPRKTMADLGILSQVNMNAIMRSGGLQIFLPQYLRSQRIDASISLYCIDGQIVCSRYSSCNGIDALFAFRGIKASVNNHDIIGPFQTQLFIRCLPELPQSSQFASISHTPNLSAKRWMEAFSFLEEIKENELQVALSLSNIDISVDPDIVASLTDWSTALNTTSLSLLKALNIDSTDQLFSIIPHSNTINYDEMAPEIKVTICFRCREVCLTVKGKKEDIELSTTPPLSYAQSSSGTSTPQSSAHHDKLEQSMVELTVRLQRLSTDVVVSSGVEKTGLELSANCSILAIKIDQISDGREANRLFYSGAVVEDRFDGPNTSSPVEKIAFVASRLHFKNGVAISSVQVDELQLLVLPELVQFMLNLALSFSPVGNKDVKPFSPTKLSGVLMKPNKTKIRSPKKSAQFVDQAAHPSSIPMQHYEAEDNKDEWKSIEATRPISSASIILLNTLFSPFISSLNMNVSLLGVTVLVPIDPGYRRNRRELLSLDTKMEFNIALERPSLDHVFSDKDMSSIIPVIVIDNAKFSMSGSLLIPNLATQFSGQGVGLAHGNLHDMGNGGTSHGSMPGKFNFEDNFSEHSKQPHWFKHFAQSKLNSNLVSNLPIVRIEGILNLSAHLSKTIENSSDLNHHQTKPTTTTATSANSANSEEWTVQYAPGGVSFIPKIQSNIDVQSFDLNLYTDYTPYLILFEEVALPMQQVLKSIDNHPPTLQSKASDALANATTTNNSTATVVVSDLLSFFSFIDRYSSFEICMKMPLLTVSLINDVNAQPLLVSRLLLEDTELQGYIAAKHSVFKSITLCRSGFSDLSATAVNIETFSPKPHRPSHNNVSRDLLQLNMNSGTENYAASEYPYETKVRFRSKLSVDYQNQKLLAIEPLIEPVAIIADISIYKQICKDDHPVVTYINFDKGQSFIGHSYPLFSELISSDAKSQGARNESSSMHPPAPSVSLMLDKINVNLTIPLLEATFLTLKSINSLDKLSHDSNLVDRGEVAMVMIRNESGLPIRYWNEPSVINTLGPNSEAPILGRMAQDWASLNAYSKKINIAIQRPDGSFWPSIQDVSLEGIGCRILTLHSEEETPVRNKGISRFRETSIKKPSNSNHTIVLELAARNGRKVLTIRSTLRLFNATKVPFVVKLLCDSEDTVQSQQQRQQQQQQQQQDPVWEVLLGPSKGIFIPANASNLVQGSIMLSPKEFYASSNHSGSGNSQSHGVIPCPQVIGLSSSSRVEALEKDSDSFIGLQDTDVVCNKLHRRKKLVQQRGTVNMRSYYHWVNLKDIENDSESPGNSGSGPEPDMYSKLTHGYRTSHCNVAVESRGASSKRSPNTENAMLRTVKIVPPVTAVNLLARDIIVVVTPDLEKFGFFGTLDDLFEYDTNLKDFIPQYTLRPGEVAEWLSIHATENFYLSIKFVDDESSNSITKWSSFVKVLGCADSSQQSTSQTLQLVVGFGNNSSLTVLLDVIDRGGCRCINIYVPYWIVSSSFLPLQFQHASSDTGLNGVDGLAADQVFDEKKAARRTASTHDSSSLSSNKLKINPRRGPRGIGRARGISGVVLGPDIPVKGLSDLFKNKHFHSNIVTPMSAMIYSSKEQSLSKLNSANNRHIANKAAYSAASGGLSTYSGGGLLTTNLLTSKSTKSSSVSVFHCSYTNKDKRQGRVRFRHRSTGWSSSINLDTAGNKHLQIESSITVDINDYDGDRSVNSPFYKDGKKLFHLGASVQTLEPPFHRTKAVLVVDKYVAVNLVGQSIEIKQHSQDNIFSIRSNETSSIWFRPGPLILQVRLARYGWSWSGKFSVDSAGEIPVRLRNDYDNTVYFILIHAFVSGPTVKIIFKGGDKYSPYRFENHTVETFRIRQQGQLQHTNLLPYHCCAYAWDEPLAPHTFTLSILKNALQAQDEWQEIGSFTFNRIEPLKKTSFAYLSLRIVAQGPTRVLQIQDLRLSLFNNNRLLHMNNNNNNNNNNNKATRVDSKQAISDSNERKQVNPVLFHLNVTVDLLGVSVVDHLPQEIMYISLSNVACEQIFFKRQSTTNLSIGRLQIDNQLWSTPYPSLLHPLVPWRDVSALPSSSNTSSATVTSASTSSGANNSANTNQMNSRRGKFLSLYIKQDFEYDGVFFFPAFKLELAPFDLNLELTIITSLINMVNYSYEEFRETTILYSHSHHHSHASAASLLGGLQSPSNQMSLQGRASVYDLLDAISAAPISMGLAQKQLTKTQVLTIQYLMNKLYGKGRSINQRHSLVSEETLSTKFTADEDNNATTRWRAGSGYSSVTHQSQQSMHQSYEENLSLSSYYVSRLVDKAQDIEEAMKPATKLYFQRFELSQIRLNISFNPVLSMDVAPFEFESLVFGALNAVLLAIGSTFANIDNCPLRFQPLMLEHAFTSGKGLSETILSNYAIQAAKQAYLVLFSSQLLGNPVELLQTLGEGLWDFMYMPVMGLFTSPEAFIVGAMRGTSSLLRTVVASVCTTAGHLATSVQVGLITLGSIDSYPPPSPAHASQQNDSSNSSSNSGGSGGSSDSSSGRVGGGGARGGLEDSSNNSSTSNANTPSSSSKRKLISHTSSSGASLSSEASTRKISRPSTLQDAIRMGIYGVVLDPLNGLRDDGLRGLLVGIAKGSTGLLARPLYGVLGFMASILEKVSFSILPRYLAYQKMRLGRVRPPRFFSSPNLPLQVYSAEENVGQELLSRLEGGAYRSEGYVWHCLLSNGGQQQQLQSARVSHYPSYHLNQQQLQLILIITKSRVMILEDRLEFTEVSWQCPIKSILSIEIDYRDCVRAPGSEQSTSNQMNAADIYGGFGGSSSSGNGGGGGSGGSGSQAQQSFKSALLGRPTLFFYHSPTNSEILGSGSGSGSSSLTPAAATGLGSTGSSANMSTSASRKVNFSAGSGLKSPGLRLSQKKVVIPSHEALVQILRKLLIIVPNLASPDVLGYFQAVGVDVSAAISQYSSRFREVPRDNWLFSTPPGTPNLSRQHAASAASAKHALSLLKENMWIQSNTSATTTSSVAGGTEDRDGDGEVDDAMTAVDKVSSIGDDSSSSSGSDAAAAYMPIVYNSEDVSASPPQH